MRERTVKKVISVLMVFMMVLTILPFMPHEVQAGSSYGQVTGSSPKVEGNFDFTLAINGSSTGVFVETGEAVAGTTAALTTAGTTIMFADGFNYKGTYYDVYVKVTPDVDLASTAWACKSGSSYITLSPNTKSGEESKFTYEIWLMDGDTRVTNINMVAGSCYTAASEGARPYSDNGTIYTTIPSSAIAWNSDFSAYSPTSGNYDQSSIYMLGHGTSSEGSIKGGYVRTSGNGGCEIVWGYLTEITFRNEDGAHAGALGNTAQNIDVSGLTAIDPPSTSPEKGYYFSHWTIVDSNGDPVDVETTSGGTFAAGKELTTAELKTVKANKEFTVVAHYASYSSETTNKDGDDTSANDEFILKKDGKKLVTVDIEADDMVYNGSPYTADDKVIISNLTETQIEELIQAGYITDRENLSPANVTYYVANDGDTEPVTLTTEENSGAAGEGGLPVEVGKYFAVLTFEGGDRIYTTFNITPDEKSMVEAEDYEGVYDGKAHTIKVTVPDGAKVTYSETEDGVYSSKAPSYTDVTDGAQTVYYKVTLSNGEEVTGSATVTINPVEDHKVTAKDYEGVYDGKPHTISVDIPEGATITYSATEDGTYSETAPTYTDVTNGAEKVYYKVTFADGTELTGWATVTITDEDVTTEDNSDSTTVNGGEAGSTEAATDNGSQTGSTEAGTTQAGKNAVQTGDTSAPLVIFGICVAALLGAAGIITYRRRR